jgi:uncharacterized protein YggE
MSDRAGLLLSVRGEARRVVAPDYAEVALTVAVSRGSKAEAARAAAAGLDALVLAAGEAVAVLGVSWHVDWDNPAWPLVRADAVQAAIGKGRDYAAALGGTLRSVEHIADAGLLGGGGSSQFGFTGSRVLARAASRGAAEPDAPSLDPVPQELAAVIEARLTADSVSLTMR